MPQLVSTGLKDLYPMVRSEGKHVSHAIRRVCIQLGHFDDSPFPDDKTRLEMGTSFEDSLVTALANRVQLSDPGRYIRPGELLHNGVYGTLDLFDVINWAVVEVKLTWLSTKWGPDSQKFWKYWKQIQAYCKLMSEFTQSEVTKGELWICHINGDWKFGGGGPCQWCGKPIDGPHLHVWADKFEQGEIDDTWNMIEKWAA